MSVDHECDFPETCPVCLGPAPKPVLAIVRRFTARFPGDCRECSLPVYEGQRIAELSDGRYVHVGCEP